MEQVVRARAGLTDEQVAALAAAGVNNANDLSSLTFEDIREILPAPTGILIVRRLASISKFVARGQALTPLTTMAMINSYNDLQERAPPAAAPPAAAAAADPSRSALKLSVNPMDEFSGLHSDWEVWYIETEATLRQTTFSGLLDQGPPEGNAALQVRNKEFYAMLIRAVHTGFAQHLVTKIKEQDGHAAWEALKEWYGSGETSSTLIDHHRNKLKNAVCDEDHSASEYINTFILSTDKLSELGEAMTDHTKKADFLAGITDPDYEIDIRNLKARANTTFNDIVHAIRKREQDIAVEASQRQRGETGSSRTKARRATNGGEGKSSNNAKIPFIPPLVMSYFTDSNAKKALIVWRTIWNEERRMPRADELPSRDGDDRVGSGADHNTGSASTRKSGKGKKVKGGARTRRTSATTVDGGAPDSTKASAGVVKTRLTKTASRGLKDSTVVVRIKDSDDEGSTSTASDDDGNMDDTKDTHESSAAKTARASRKRKAKGKKKLANSVKDSKEKKPKKTRRNPRSRRGRSTDRPRAIIDPGSEVHIIGGVGWEVISQVNKSTQVDGALPGMVGQKLPFVCAVTVYEHPTRGPVLIGCGNVAWVDCATHTESLFNSHLLRSCGVEVDDKAERDGGLSRLQFDGVDVKLDFVSGATLSFYHRKPTDKELVTLNIHWLVPRRPSMETGHLFKPIRRAPAQLVAEQAEWRARLGDCQEFVAAKTLEATTQLCEAPVEMENRENPRQHRMKRLLALHPRRVEGRTDSDTFFSSVTSIRGYTCVQLFFSLTSKFLFARCLKKESESHAAYQDFIRYIGAPNVLLTDNAQTQIGKKWTKTSRENCTKQKATVPHNQQQNQAEGGVRIVKQRVILTLRYAKAPLVFWCYCLLFIIDCINHSARKQLEWRTPYEKMWGMTPDISMFRFSFWQPVWYFEPTAKFPALNFLPGRFVGIAWDHGDAFTYRIWTTPEGDWKRGRELIRNVVKPRVENDDAIGIADYELKDDALVLERRDVIGTARSRKRKRQATRRRHGKQQRQDHDDSSSSSDSSDDEIDSVGNDDDVASSPSSCLRGGKHSKEKGAADATRDKHKNKVTFNVSDGHSDSKSKTVSRDKRGSRSNVVVETVAEDDEEEASDSETPSTANNAKRTREETEAEELFPDFNPLEKNDVEMATEVNNVYSANETDSTIGGAHVCSINGHEWKEGRLRLRVVWNTGESTWEELKEMKEDHPRLTAQYILHYKVTRSTGTDRTISWAKKTMRDFDRAVRRITRLYDFHLDDNDEVYTVRRTQKKKKKRPFSAKPVLKYGVQVPRNVREAIRLDQANGNTFWKDAIELEINSLTDLECFEFKPSDFNPGAAYQKTTLVVIFDVKQDMRHKARLVAGGHLVDALDHNIYSSTVKGISVKLLHVIAHKAKLRQICGDVANAYVNAYTNEKVYAVAGPEFGPELEGKIVIIVKALYGLSTSSERWHAHFADTLRGLGFVPTGFDKDVWIRLAADGTHYEYICTHVDDFMIVGKEPEEIMKAIQLVYSVKSIGPPEYYLGNDYKKDSKGRWCIGCKKYLTEAIKRVERMFEVLKKFSNPTATGDHPELDTSELLSDDEHRKYQMLIGMLVWIVTIGRADVAHATASLSRFTASPRKGHLERVLRVFGYLKKRPNRRFVVDSRDAEIIGGEDAMSADYTKELEDQYENAVEEVDTSLPKALIDEILITVFVDSDHAHDQVTRRSITGLLILLGRTPVMYASKRQGSIETSTYGAEFCAMKTAVEELIAIRYMLRCLGVKVTRASVICGDNMGVVQNATLKASILKKKHVAIAYHKTREAAAAGICHPVKIDGNDNFADCLTKGQTQKAFSKCVGGFMHG